jgi:hypothetical protein
MSKRQWPPASYACLPGTHGLTGAVALAAPLLRKLLYGLQIHNPVVCRATPPLRFRPQLGSLACRGNTDIEHRRVAYRSRIDRRAALRTKCLRAFCAAFGSLYINLWLPAQAKRFPCCGHADAKGGPRKCLAIRAMAYPDLLGINFRTIGDITAMARAVDLHNRLLHVFNYRCATVC